jgi:four helix bundle protein
MKDYKHLEVWRSAHRLALAVYENSCTFPKDELYGLTSQMRRAAVSICANIAEGCGRKSDVNWRAFCRSPEVRQANWITTFCWRMT